MKVVSFVNMKGGVGKTTLAVNIAAFLTHRHSKKVLLVDVDPQFNATQCMINGDDYVKYIKNGGTTIKDVFNYKNPFLWLEEQWEKNLYPIPVLSHIKPLVDLTSFRVYWICLGLKWLLVREQRIS